MVKVRKDDISVALGIWRKHIMIRVNMKNCLK